MMTLIKIDAKRIRMEKVFFEYDDVKVTNSRFINGANTYAMSGITSIKLREKKPDMIDVAICAFISMICLFNSMGNSFLIVPALIFAGLAYFLYKKKQTLYAIILSTAGGESEGLLSNQLEYTTQVVNALNQAVIYRE
jgi:hypothetical protein